MVATVPALPVATQTVVERNRPIAAMPDTESRSREARQLAQIA